MEQWEAQELLDDIAGSQHEDCECEECLIDREEEKEYQETLDFLSTVRCLRCGYLVPVCACTA